MRDLIFSAAAVCICASVIGMLSFEGKGGLKKQISFACALAVCSAILTPLIKLISTDIKDLSISVPDIGISDNNEAESAIAELTVENICREMERQVGMRFDIDSARLTLTLDTSDTTAIVITSGTLYGKGDLKNAAEYIEDQLGCKIHTEEAVNE